MNNYGNKGILENSNKVKEIKRLIVDFDENHNIKPKITYKGIYEYVKLQFERELIDFYPSYTWWKTKGKHLIDEYNLVKKRTIKLSESEELDVFDIFDVVEKHYADKESLINYLLPYKELVDRLENKFNNLQSKYQELLLQIDQKDSQITELKKVNSNQLDLIDGLFYTILGSERELKKVIKDGSTNLDAVNCALSNTFINPESYIEEFSKRIILKDLSIDDKIDNVIDFNPTIEENNKHDDYDY